MRQRIAVAAALCVMSTSVGGVNPPGDELRLSRSSRGIPVILASAGAETLRLGLDTGTSRTLVSAAAARRLGLVPSERLSVRDAGAARAGFCGTAPALRVGGVSLVPDCLGWLPDEERLAGAEDLDGVFGADLLSQVDLWIDLRSSRVRARIAPPGSLMAWVSGTPLSVDMIGRRPVVGGRLAALRRDGPEARLVVDSGTDNLVLFGEAARRTQALALHDRMDAHVQSVTTRRDAVMIPVSGFRTGGALFQMPWAGLLPEVKDRTEDGLLPLIALGPVLFDLSHRVIVANARMRAAEN